MNEPIGQHESALQIAANPSTSRSSVFARRIGGLAHLLLFGIALLLIMPDEVSDGPRFYTPTPERVVISCACFALSMGIARLLNRESITGLVLKSAFFVMYASRASHVMGEMAHP